MKKSSVFMLLFVLFFSLTAIGQKDNMAIIKGKISFKNNPPEIALYSIANGEAVPHSKVAVAKDGTFGFCFTPEYSGLYRIGERNSPARLYITPGKQTSIELNETTLTILNPKDKENLKLEEWSKIINPLKSANNLGVMQTYKDIFPILPDLEKQTNAFVASEKTGNPVFDKFLKGMAKAEFEYELYHFLFMPRTAHPKFEEHPEVYKRMSSGPHFPTTEILNYDFGMSALGSYVQYLFSIKSSEGIKYSPELNEKLCIENVKNDTLIGWYFINNRIVRAKAYDQGYRDMAEKYNKYILTDIQKKKVHDFELTIRSFGDGEQAMNFEGKTVDGKSLSLTDFKGKVVLVDVWATWCGPCKKEIPDLQKLEEEMKGKDVVFISYSIDEAKDHEKWIKMIDDMKLGGIQLFGPAAWKSPICVNYKIAGIPRFMVFGKKGQIVTIDSPRPSNPDLKILLEKQLKQ
jgi:thiol-disulfide isomerase/thioredoxin